MNTEYIIRYPVAMTIAGSDSGGGAGIQADLKTFSALGVYGASAITAVTAQNTLGVRGIQAISPEILRGQIEAVMEDFPVDAVKIGMLHNQEAIRVVSKAIDCHRPRWIVLDPVMISTSGSQLLEEGAIDLLINKLFKQAHLVTPNRDEAAFITGMPIRNEQEMERAGLRLLEMGCQAVLMKGGHLSDNGHSTDILFQKGETAIRLSVPMINTRNTHGTGCTLSSAITAFLALGESLPEAVRKAKAYLTEALTEGAGIHTGHGHGPVNHFFNPQPLQKIKRSE